MDNFSEYLSKNCTWGELKKPLIIFLRSPTRIISVLLILVLLLLSINQNGFRSLILILLSFWILILLLKNFEKIKESYYKYAEYNFQAVFMKFELEMLKNKIKLICLDQCIQHLNKIEKTKNSEYLRKIKNTLWNIDDIEIFRNKYNEIRNKCHDNKDQSLEGTEILNMIDEILEKKDESNFLITKNIRNNILYNLNNFYFKTIDRYDGYLKYNESINTDTYSYFIILCHIQYTFNLLQIAEDKNLNFYLSCIDELLKKTALDHYLERAKVIEEKMLPYIKMKSRN